METAVYVLTDIPFLDSNSPFRFIKKDLKLLKEKELGMIPEYERTEAQSLPLVSKKNNHIWNYTQKYLPYTSKFYLQRYGNSL